MASFPLRQSVCLLSCWADLGWGEARCNSLQKTLNNRSKCWIGNSKSQWTCLPFITGAIYSRLGESPQQDKLELFTRAKCISALHNRGTRQAVGSTVDTLERRYIWWWLERGAGPGRGWKRVGGGLASGRSPAAAACSSLAQPSPASPAQPSPGQIDVATRFPAWLCLSGRPGPGPPALTNTEAIFKSVFCFCAIGWKRAIVSARRRSGSRPGTTQPPARLSIISDFAILDLKASLHFSSTS